MDEHAIDTATAQLRLAGERFGFPVDTTFGERLISVRECRAIVTPITGAIASVVDVLHVSDHTMGAIYRADVQPGGDVFVTLVDLGSDQAEILMRISSARRLADRLWHVEMHSAVWDPYASARAIERSN